MVLVEDDPKNHSRNVGADIKRLEKIFSLKSQLEERISREIEEYEDATGLKIDKIRFYREDTVKIGDGIYTELTVTVG